MGLNDVVKKNLKDGKGNEPKKEQAERQLKGIRLTTDSIDLLNKLTLHIKADDSKHTVGDTVEMGLILLAAEKGLKH